MSHIPRNPHARADVTLDICESFQFAFEPDSLRTIIACGGERRVISWVEIFR